MGFICFICGVVFGGIFGVAAMCCLQAGSRADGKEKDSSRLE